MAIAVPLPDLKVNGTKTHISFQSDIEVKNARSSNSTHVCVFVTCKGRTAPLLYRKLQQ